MHHHRYPGSLFTATAWFIAATLSISGCSESDQSPTSPTLVEDGSTKTDTGEPQVIFTDPVKAENGRLFDAEGREIVLRGFKARVEGLFDVTFNDGRTALQPIPSFTGADCQVLAEELGQNLLRLPVNWSGIEPQKGVYNEAYLGQVVELIQACWEHGVYTLVDLHQDAYSKEIGEDGAPLWAIIPEPPELLEGPLTEEELARRRTSPEVLAAFESFFDNVDGLQDAYGAMAAHLAERIMDEPGVMGLELMNEPVILKDLIPGEPGLLDAFHQRVSEAIRAVAPELTLVFEPNSLRNFTDAWAVSTPFPFDDAVYSPHVYTDVFTDGWAGRDIEKLHGSVIAAKEEANVHGTPLLVGEYGNTPTTETGQLWLKEVLDKMDEVGASAAVWLYEEQSQGSWGLYDMIDGERGAMRDPFARLISRPYPQAIDGHILGFQFNMETRTLTVKFENAGEGEHILAAPDRLYPEGVSVTCDDVPVEIAGDKPGRVFVRCEGKKLVMTAAP